MLRDSAGFSSLLDERCWRCGVDDVNYACIAAIAVVAVCGTGSLLRLYAAQECWFSRRLRDLVISKLCNNARYNGCPSRRVKAATLERVVARKCVSKR